MGTDIALAGATVVETHGVHKHDQLGQITIDTRADGVLDTKGGWGTAIVWCVV